MRRLYRNYSRIDLNLYDLLQVNKREIISQYQIINIWEYLLNVKTDRNIELFGNNKIKINENSEKRDNQFYKIDLFVKINDNVSLISYIKYLFYRTIKVFSFNFDNFFVNHENNIIENKDHTIYQNDNIFDIQEENEKIYSEGIIFFVKDIFKKMFKFFELNSREIINMSIIIISGLFNYLNKYLIKVPKLNLIIVSILLFLNLKGAFYFYSKNLFFLSCLIFWFFIICIHNIYLILAILCENKENDLSIFFDNDFKTEKIFFLKVFMVSLIILVNKYFNLFFFKRFYLSLSFY